MKKKLASGIVELLIGAGGFAAVLLCEPKFWGIALLGLGLWIIIALFIKTNDEMSETAKKFARSTNIICACIWLLVAAYLYFCPSEKLADNTAWIYISTYIFLIAHGVSSMGVAVRMKKSEN